jgi:hypothetical protein
VSPTTAIPPIDLAVLEDRLQQRLQERLPEISPLQVSCTLKQHTLLTVVYHPQPVLAHPMRVFRVLEGMFQAEKLGQRFRGLMYVQVQGQAQPYAFHNVLPDADWTAADVADQVRANTPDGLHERGEIATPPPPPANEMNPIAPPDPLSHNPPAHLPDIDEQLEPVEPDLEAEYGVEAEAAARATAGRFVPLEKLHLSDIWVERLSLALIAIGSLLGVGIFLGSLYALSRPCVLLGCENLTQAQTIAEQSVSTLQNPGSGQAVLEAQAQLDRAILLLEKIPPWSGRHGEAQNLIADYESTANKVDVLVRALQTANQAANLTQNPPLPLATWQAAVEEWESAIAQLETLPPTSPFYAFARQKIQEYRTNLAVVSQRMTIEQQAAENLAAAQEAAKIAEVRSGIAQSATDLQLAYSTWQTAINALEAIPADSPLAPEAQQLLAEYKPKANVARDRQTFELFANDNYNQALRSAEQAKIAQEQNQWTQAVSYWRAALNAVKQIPRNSFNYTRAQPLINDYQTALSRAEARLDGSLLLQKADEELEKVCTLENPRICLATVNREKIIVRLTDTYVQKIRTNASRAQSQGNVEAQVDIREHIVGLEQALEEISDRAGVPLEIYTHNNILVKAHQPR